MANSSGLMSHHGAQGTVWTLVAPNELARLASLQPVATRRLPRVQVDRPGRFLLLLLRCSKGRGSAGWRNGAQRAPVMPKMHGTAILTLFNGLLCLWCIYKRQMS